MLREDHMRVRRHLLDNLVTDEGQVRLEVVDRIIKNNAAITKLLDLNLSKDLETSGVVWHINTTIPGLEASAGEVIEGEAEDIPRLSAPEESEGA